MNIKKNLYWFLKFLSERNQRAHYTKHYKYEIEHYNGYKDKKPAGQMKKEMKILKKYWGCYPFQYIRYGMYKKSCPFTIEQMKDYVPNYFAYYLFFPKIFKDYGIVSEDKEITYRMLDSYSIHQPVLLLQYKNGVLYNKDKTIIDAVEANKIIQNSYAEKLFLKPTTGLGGRGIIVFNKKDSFKNKAGDELSADFIKKTLGNDCDYLLQEGLRQHDALNSIYPNAVNTFRIMTHTVKGETRIMFAMLRMGQGGNQLDNASQKGLVCKIDPESGAFNHTGHTGLGKTMDQHPDSQFVFKGFVFPYWKEVREFIMDASLKFETIPYIGWDVAFTTDGPAIIELNAGAGLEYLQDSHGGVRKAYGIENPKKYWYNDRFVVKDL